MPTLITQMAVIQSDTRSRPTLLKRGFGIRVDTVSKTEHALKTGDSVSGQARKQLVISAPDEFNPVDVTITQGSASITFTGIKGLLSLPVSVLTAYTIAYPYKAGGQDIIVTTVTA